MTDISGAYLRSTMRLLPSPVTVITSALDGQIRGTTVGSFTSVSLEPALVSLNLSIETPTLAFIEKALRFVVHFLREDQADVSGVFAIPDRSGAEQFAEVSYDRDEHGLPIIEGVLARLYCTVEALHPAGDHTLVVGRVYRIDEPAAGRPLVYYNRGYHTVGDAVDV